MRRIHVSTIHQAAHCRKPGYTDAVFAVAKRLGHDFIELSEENFNEIRNKYALKGPGFFLHKTLLSFGIGFKSGCKCKARMCQMNKWGCEGCEENIDTIVEWMKEEAAARGLPYLSAVGRMLVRRAIHNARKEAERAKDPPH